jgi:prepilin-type N-terminal cleavage/methylation domain-containing protein
MRSTTATPLRSDAGFSLVELLVTMGIFTVIMGATMTGLSDIIKGNDTVLQMAAMNNSVRAGMDLMVRDLLQVGSGLPASHAVTIPSGAGAIPVRIPGPPGSTFQTAVGDETLPAVMPFPRQGPTIDGVQTDALTVLMADNAFLDIQLSSLTNTSVVVVPGTNLSTGPDRVVPGQLMLISKGSFNTLVQVTAVDPGSRQLTFSDGDSLNLNQSGAGAGNLTFLNAQAPANSAAATRISRIRMISYYLEDSTDVNHPRLVRRVNNGDAMTFDNDLGTAVALDAVDLQFAFDVVNGTNNPGNVEMVSADLVGTGACAPNPCGRTQVRKVNVTVTGRSQNKVPPRNIFLHNTLESQVSFRGMAFVDQYR